MEMNIGKLKQIYQTGPLAEAVFKTLASRQRPREFLDLTRLKDELLEQGYQVDKDDFLNIFKRLQEAGFGKLINKRSPTDHLRFRWGQWNLIEVGKRALGSTTHKSDDMSTRTAHKPSAIRSSGAEVIRAAYRFRSGDQILLSIPRDEVRDLAEFIEGLAD
jgi:hypothetical protein